MKSLKNWMVALDLSDHDDHLIQYTHQLALTLVPDEIVFVHIMPRVEIPERFISHPKPQREEIKKEIEAKVYKVFRQQAFVTCEVHAGTPYFDLWRESHLHQTDLLILGEKNIEKGRKIVPENFVRKSFCSVLFVPKVTGPIKKIWVPVDFSDNSKDAIDLSVEIHKIIRGTTVVLHHVFETPSLSLIEKSMRDEYVSYFEESAKAKLSELVKARKLTGIEYASTHWVYVKPSDHIKEAAEEADASLIIMGSGGKNRFSSWMLGSNTSEMIQLEKNIPLLILKERIDRVHSWDILTNL
jgi:nucleotide-binding universal stress UspA family protein